MGQTLAANLGWRAGVLGFFVLALGMLPAAWYAGKVDKAALSQPTAGQIGETSIKAAIGTALSTARFLVMAGAYFVCGMQLLFITTHLPSYLALCGMDPMLGAEALGVIGGFNVVGSLFFGWAGGRWSKLALLGMIYISRSMVLGWYFVLPPTPASTLVFAALMGFLWLGVGPLVAGSVVEMFGLRWQAMIQGLAFMSHQVGSFLGAFGGGLLFDALGSYDLAWRLGVGMGLTAGIVQVAFALLRPLHPTRGDVDARPREPIRRRPLAGRLPRLQGGTVAPRCCGLVAGLLHTSVSALIHHPIRASRAGEVGGVFKLEACVVGPKPHRTINPGEAAADCPDPRPPAVGEHDQLGAT
jgi:hypothetical protein